MNIAVKPPTTIPLTMAARTGDGVKAPMATGVRSVKRHSSIALNCTYEKGTGTCTG